MPRTEFSSLVLSWVLNRSMPASARFCDNHFHFQREPLYCQVLGEDMKLVTGQQRQLIKGGNTWANPVAYDKLAVRYRRWRNSLAPHGESPAGAKAPAPVVMSSGEMFKDDCDVEACDVADA